MARRNIYFIAVMGTLMVLLVVVSIIKPKPLDWRETFSNTDKIPFGNYVLYQRLSGADLFGFDQFDVNQTTLYEFIAAKEEIREQEMTYFFICDRFSPDEIDANLLMDHVKKGANIFIATNDLGGPLSDSLNIYTTVDYDMYFFEPDSIKIDSAGAYLVQNQQRIHHFLQGTMLQYLELPDSLEYTVLAYSTNNMPIYIQVPHGSGKFYIHANPTIFTNIHMLQDDSRAYIERALSYLPSSSTWGIWDEYYKKGRTAPKTPLRFILSNDALRWGWFCMLFTVSIYILFSIKRRQKAIPVHTAPTNSTLDFVNTVSSLYYSTNNHHNIALKMITYFKEYLRTKLFVSVETVDDLTLETLASKTGKSKTELMVLFNQIGTIEKGNKPDALELKLLSDRIEEVKGNATLSHV